MIYRNLDLLVPRLEPERGYDEAALLGMVVWLWMRSEVHQPTPLYALQTMVLPALKYRQFVLGREGETPVFFCSWASFSEDAEERYLDSPKDIRDEDWRSGDRLWLLDWVAPFGHTPALSPFIRTQLFPDEVWHGLRHKPQLPGRDRVAFGYGSNRGAHGPHPHSTVPRKTLWRVDP